MNSAGNKNWPLVVAILAVLAVPFAIAAIQDIGRDSTGAETPDAPPVPDPAAEPGGDLALAGDPEPGRGQRMEQSFFDRVLLAEAGGKRFGGALGGADFGMTRDQVRVHAGGLWRWAEQGVTEFGPAVARLHFEERGGEGLSGVAIRFPDDGAARAILAGAWDQPVEALGQDEATRAYWFDQASGTRVALRPNVEVGITEITVERVQPVASLYRRGRGFAFETRPILGASPAELAAAYGADFESDPSSPGSARLLLPPTDYALARTQCTIGFSEGKAVALQVAVEHAGRVDFGPRAFEALREQLGPVRDSHSDQHARRWSFDDGITVQQFARSPQIIVSVSRP
jgi:hypothetical protein